MYCDSNVDCDCQPSAIDDDDVDADVTIVDDVLLIVDDDDDDHVAMHLRLALMVLNAIAEVRELAVHDLAMVVPLRHVPIVLDS